MAHYRPDYKLIEADKVLKELDTSIKENELILYYINDKNKRIEKLREEIKEYQDFFKQLDKFLPNKNPIFK